MNNINGMINKRSGQNLSTYAFYKSGIKEEH